MIAASRVRIGSDHVAGQPGSPLQRDPSVCKASLNPSPGLWVLAPSASAGLPRNPFFFFTVAICLAGFIVFLPVSHYAQAPDKMFAIVGYKVSGSAESGPVKWSDERPIGAPCSVFSDFARSVLVSGVWITVVAGPTSADGVPIEGEYWITTETRPGEYAELHLMTTGRIFVRVEVHPADESAGEDGKCVVVSSSLSIRKTMYGPCSVENLIGGEFVPVTLMRRSGGEGWSRGSGVYSKQLKAILTVRHVGELAPLIVMVWSENGLAKTPAWLPVGVVKHFVCDVSGVCVSFVDSGSDLAEALDSIRLEWPKSPGIYSLVTPIAAKPEFLKVSGIDYPGLVIHELSWWPVIYGGCSGSGLFVVDRDFVKLVGVLSSGEAFQERRTVIVSYVPVCPKDKDVWRALREAQRVQEAKHAGEGD